MLSAEPFEDALKNQSVGPVLSKAASVECISPISPRPPDAKMLEELKAELWYQGQMSRKEAEGLLKRDGDFLVRKSTTNPGSFVLTGMHDGQAKHLLLVDPEGTVSTGWLLSLPHPQAPAEAPMATLQDPEPGPGPVLSHPRGNAPDSELNNTAMSALLWSHYYPIAHPAQCRDC